jgi:hypothetical protein
MERMFIKKSFQKADDGLQGGPTQSPRVPFALMVPSHSSNQLKRCKGLVKLERGTFGFRRGEGLRSHEA